MRTKLLKKLRKKAASGYYSIRIYRDGHIVLVTKGLLVLTFENEKKLDRYLRVVWHTLATDYLEDHPTKIRKRKKNFFYIW